MQQLRRVDLWEIANITISCSSEIRLGTGPLPLIARQIAGRSQFDGCADVNATEFLLSLASASRILHDVDRARRHSSPTIGAALERVAGIEPSS